MRVYKPSGIKWLGEIPQSWEIKKLKYIGEIFGGVTGKTIKDFSKEYKLNFKPYITFTNVCNNAVINPDLMEYVFIDSKEKQNKVLKNDILFLQSSETFEDVGKSAIYLNDDEVYLNTFCKGFRIEREAYPMYLNYLLSSLSYKRYFMSVCSGFTRINLRQEHFLDIPLILPPLQEQKEIAEFLDSKCEKIQNYIEKKQKLITLLQEKKQALINEAVTKGLNPNIEFKPSGIEWLGEIPQSWEIKKCKFFFIIQNTIVGDLWNKTKLLSLTLNGVVERDINNPEGKFPSDFSTYQLVKRGNLVFCLFDVEETPRAIGLSQIDGMITSAYTVIKVVNQNERFLAYLFISLDNGKNLSFLYRGLRKTISKEDLLNLKIPLPPLQEQKEIAAFLDSKVAQIDSVIEKTKKQIELVKEYKNTLINEAVCGRIRVN